MNPVAIFRHAPTEGPAYFATYLERLGIPWRLVRVDAGEPVPRDAGAYAGCAFMGGPMSVNDPLPWIAAVLDFIRKCVAEGVPVLGHCLGGQLMSKALGGSVGRNPVKEIGWGEVRVAGNSVAKQWFGHAGESFLSFHWHGETFTVPPGGERVLSSQHCANQAFAFGSHLAMQCHIEMTAEMISAWCESGAQEIRRSNSPAVQSSVEIRSDIESRLEALRHVADGVYAHWVTGLQSS